MKILQIFGAVVAVHLLAFIFIFASPGCQSSQRNFPTPDATLPTGQTVSPAAPDAGQVQAQPVDLGTGADSQVSYSPGRAAPTRPGSPAAAALVPSRPVAGIAPVSTYTVTRGDSLWSIAKKNGLTVAELARQNNLSPGTTLKPGKKLIIPGKVGAPAHEAMAEARATDEKAAATPARGGSEAVRHTVQPGESLGVIARKYQVSTGELAAANSITDPSKVRAGQQLIIPGFKAVGTGTKAKAAPGKTKASVKAPAPAKADASPAPDAPAEPAPSINTPHFELTPPPAGQDLDAGLKDTGTAVPTIKVETPKADQPPQG